MSGNRLAPILAAYLLAPAAASGLPAFPGAEGFGTDTPGGRGGDLYIVTVVDAPGQASDYAANQAPIPGSLRHAVESATGPRTIIFRSGGTITLVRKLVLATPFLTIAGHTASGDGILIRNNPLGLANVMAGYAADSFTSIAVATHDVVLRNLRIRPGPLEENPDCDGLNGFDPPPGAPNFTTCVDANDIQAISIDPGSYNVVMDRLSLSWASDETIDVTLSTDITLQRSIVAEGLNYVLYDQFVCMANPPPQGCSPGSFDGKGIIIGDAASSPNGDAGRISIHHDFWSHLTARTPQMGNYCSTVEDPDPDDCVSHAVNNVLYNWFDHGIDMHNFAGHHYSRVEANYIADGPDRKTAFGGLVIHDWDEASVLPGDPELGVDVTGNVRETSGFGVVGPSPIECSVRVGSGFVACDPASYPLPPVNLPAITTDAAEEIGPDVATWGSRIRLEADGSATEVPDAVDARVVDDFVLPPAQGGRTLTIIDDYDEWATGGRGGWPSYDSGTPYADGDADGLPDTWETIHCLDPSQSSYGNDADGDVYTDLEEFLNGTLPRDGDGDGFEDFEDNCPEISTLSVPAAARQDDADGDGFGDACDCDENQDGICHSNDQARFAFCLAKDKFPQCGWADVDGDLDVDGIDQGFFEASFATGAPGPAAAACAP